MANEEKKAVLVHRELPIKGTGLGKHEIIAGILYRDPTDPGNDVIEYPAFSEPLIAEEVQGDVKNQNYPTLRD